MHDVGQDHTQGLEEPNGTEHSQDAANREDAADPRKGKIDYASASRLGCNRCANVKERHEDQEEVKHVPNHVAITKEVEPGHAELQANLESERNNKQAASTAISFGISCPTCLMP